MKKGEPVLDDPISDTSKVDRVALLTGKLYYDSSKNAKPSNSETERVALIRLAEFSPSPRSTPRHVEEVRESQGNHMGARGAEEPRSIHVCRAEGESPSPGIEDKVEDRV